MKRDRDDHDLVDRLYAVAMEPERFRELVEIWQSQLYGKETDKYFLLPDDETLIDRHLERANSILGLVNDSEDVLPRPLFEKLNSEPQAMLAVSPSGSIESMNEPARALFSGEAPFSLSDLGIEEYELGRVKTEIRRFFELAEAGLKSSPNLLRVDRPGTDIPLLITFSNWVTAGGRRFVLLRTTDFVWPADLTPVIQTAFGLTGAEADIVKLIVEGNSVDQIAEIRGSSIRTVRTQISSIYEKTSTRNQTEFIRMAIGLTTMDLIDKDIITGAMQRPKGVTAIAYPLPDHRRMISYPDGGVMDYAIFGPESGQACIFHHNEFFGDIWPIKAAQYAIANNLRIICPARACYARSTPYPRGAKNYERISEGVDLLLERHKVTKVVMISQTMGGMYSLHYAMTRPEKIAGLVSITPALPFSDKSDQDRMPKFSRFMSSIVGRHPKMLEFIAKSGFAYHNRVGSLRFLEMILQSPVDKKIVQDPNHMDAIIRGFQYGVPHGHQAILSDYKGGMLPDSDKALISLDIPTYCIIGTDEKNSRESRANSLIKAGANLIKVMAEGGGDMLLYSHPELVVDTILKAWQTSQKNN